MTDAAKGARPITFLMQPDGTITFGNRRFRSWVPSEVTMAAEVLFSEAFKHHADLVQATAASEPERVAANNDLIAEAIRRNTSATGKPLATDEARLAEELRTLRPKRYDSHGKRVLTDDELSDILADLDFNTSID